jgi:hypothetical protein
LKKPLAAALVVAAVVTLAVPAGAAPMPKTTPPIAISCGSATASVWHDSHTLAVKNPCSEWLGLGWGTAPDGNQAWLLYVAPNSSFSWKVIKGRTVNQVRFVGPKHGPLAWVGGPWDSTVWAGRPIVGQYTVGEAVYSTKVIKAPKYEVGP